MGFVAGVRQPHMLFPDGTLSLQLVTATEGHRSATLTLSCTARQAMGATALAAWITPMVLTVKGAGTASID